MASPCACRASTRPCAASTRSSRSTTTYRAARRRPISSCRRCWPSCRASSRLRARCSRRTRRCARAARARRANPTTCGSPRSAASTRSRSSRTSASSRPECCAWAWARARAAASAASGGTCPAAAASVRRAARSITGRSSSRPSPRCSARTTRPRSTLWPRPYPIRPGPSIASAWRAHCFAGGSNVAQRVIEIDPITRLEGHGKISIFLDPAGDVDRAIFQVPELRGFEQFCVGRPAEEMPQITPRICGVCPSAHHLASTKALDDLYGVEPPAAAKRIRELFYSTFMVEDHFLHFFFLGGPDFVMGPKAPAAERNILGVIGKVGMQVAGRLIGLRKRCRAVMELIAGKPIHPVCGLPGGVAKALTEEDRVTVAAAAGAAVEFAQFALKVFDDVVLGNKAYVDLVVGDIYQHRTYYMGLVDGRGRVNFYDGQVRVVDPAGKLFCQFSPRDYTKHIAEHVEPWTYVKFCYLREKGWKGMVDGPESGVYRAAPLARLNAADGMATPLAQAAYEKMYEVLGGKPAHHTLAFHWARLIEALYAAERMQELARAPELTSPKVRELPTKTPAEGVGIVEAPRGTLIHHYRTDARGVLTGVNLIVATQNNAAAICMSIEKAAKALIKRGEVNEGLLNMVEMAFRAYDPCLACATHSFPGTAPLRLDIIDSDGRLRRTIGRQ
ncbi:MAG: Ni/Fe hydrogenase subunit alpha [Deltaproteobacteria bacterium]|nr:Ni/Fe hydrogenase subunit alpha [Deltaproteobacteria bacterium]